MREKLLPLSETMHLIMLSLRHPKHGYRIMQVVSQMSGGTVNIAAGTLYGAIDNLKKHGYIELVSEPEERRKVYQVTERGLEILKMENDRLKKMIDIYENGDDYNA